MPLTFSHPVAAIPFRRCGLILSALVIGSMSPDFEYFLRLSPGFHFGHTLPGLVLFCIPSGLTALLLFHAVIKYPLFSLLPKSHQERVYSVLNAFSCRSLKDLFLIIISLFLGACTHVFWDAFTHSYGWAVRQFPILTLPLLDTPQGTLRMYKVLQHGSTIFGGLLLLYWYVKWIKNAPRTSVPEEFHYSNLTKLLILAVLGGLAGIFGLMYGIVKLPPIQDFYSFRFFAVRAGVAATSSFFVEMFMFSLGWQYLSKQRSQRPFQNIFSSR